MANNMIALQARAPQTDILGGSIARNAQMINMMRQQDVAERQAATAAKNAEIAAAQEGRAVAKEARDASAAEIELAGKQIDFYTKLAGQVMNANGYNMLLTRLDKDAPEIAQAFRTNLPPEQFDRNMLLQMVGSIGDNFKATYGPLETQVIQDADGNYGVATSGGFSAERGQQGVVPLNVLQPKTGARPPAAGGNAPAGGLRPTRGANTTPADLRAQMAPAGPATPDRLEAAARAAARGARATDPIFDGLTDDEFRQMQTRADEIRGGGASMRPASFDGGAAQPDLGGIVQQMMQTGVVSQSNLQALRAAAGPDKEQQLAQILRSSNIKIMPDEEQAGGMRNAVYRPDEGMPTLQRTQGMVEYEDTGRQFKGKPPMVSPLPGSSQVPIPRVREEAKAQRKTPQEIYDEKRMEKRAEADADFLENVPKARENAQFLTNLVGQMIGDATVNSKGQIVVKPGGRAPKAGFEDVVGATWRPGARFISGTNAADFDALLKQVEGQQFLKAYETLKGTGQITEIEGQKATDAMSRMKRSVSEVEFVRAAREFLGIVQKGLDRLNQREATLNAPAMPAGKRRTPVKKSSSGWGAVEVVGD